MHKCRASWIRYCGCGTAATWHDGLLPGTRIRASRPNGVMRILSKPKLHDVDDVDFGGGGCVKESEDDGSCGDSDGGCNYDFADDADDVSDDNTICAVMLMVSTDIQK